MTVLGHRQRIPLHYKTAMQSTLGTKGRDNGTSLPLPHNWSCMPYVVLIRLIMRLKEWNTSTVSSWYPDSGCPLSVLGGPINSTTVLDFCDVHLS